MNRSRRQYQDRSNSGQSVVALVLVLAVFVIAPLGLLVSEITRYQLASQQLKAVVDSAALAAACTNASSNVKSIRTTQQNDMTVAMNLLKMNSVLDQSLATATQASSLPMQPGANQTTVYFEFLDPTTRAPVALGSSNGKIMRITAAFGYVPIFSGILPIRGVFPIVQTANGGLPMLDLVLIFDISASMDDFTNISLVDRYLPAAAPANRYNGYAIIAQGPLYTAVGCTNTTGSALDCTYPMFLDLANGNSITCTYNFSENAGSYRGAEYGQPAPQGRVNYFTDLVVNIDDTATFSKGGRAANANGSYAFPAGNIGCLVEASRGNLESAAVATAAHVPYQDWGITPKPGYYQAYQTAAAAVVHPLSDAISAAQNFFAIMNNDCNVHFGLVTFSTNAGTTPTQLTPITIFSNNTPNHIASNFTSRGYPADPYAPSQYPPNPGIPLNSSAGPSYSNYSACNTAVRTLVAAGGTNMAGALKAALNQVLPTSAGGQGLTRPGSTPAIVLFTDGLPTISSLGGDPAQDSRNQALIANKYGIPIYCVGLCMTPSLKALQTAILTDQNSSGSTGGIAGISGHGAEFFQVTSTTQLNIVFENVARSLVQLVR